MSIVRSPRPDNHFTVVHNEVIRDSRLSYRARGILLEILSRPDNWRISAEVLARSSKEGRGAILTCLSELRDLGYIVTSKIRHENGQFETISTVYDQPTGSGKPDPGLPTSGNPTSLEEPSKEEPIRKKKEFVFEEFWKVYPRKVAKGAARKAWDKINLKEADAIIAGATRFANDPNRDETYTPHPATWLNSERWTDEPLPPKKPLNGARAVDNTPTVTPPRFTIEDLPRGVPMPDSIREVLKRV
jgi:hypothetical protein